MCRKKKTFHKPSDLYRSGEQKDTLVSISRIKKSLYTRDSLIVKDPSAPSHTFLRGPPYTLYVSLDIEDNSLFTHKSLVVVP